MTDRIRGILKDLLFKYIPYDGIYLEADIDQALSNIKQEMVKGVLGVEEIRNILGWSYTTEENSFKEMDATLMNTITKAIHEAQVKKL